MKIGTPFIKGSVLEEGRVTMRNSVSSRLGLNLTEPRVRWMLGSNLVPFLGIVNSPQRRKPANASVAAALSVISSRELGS